MNEVLKQRLVGALILVALGVIFWPIIFVEPESEQPRAQRGVPPAPQVSTEPLEAPDSSGLRASREIAVHAEAEHEPGEPTEPAPLPERPPQKLPASQPSEMPQVPEPATRREAPEPLSLDADGVPVAWVLQVASVSSDEKAEALRSRLTEMGQKAYIERVSSGGRDLFRVYVGPKFEREKLEALRDTVDAEFAVRSMVRRYVP